jgi:hypothetical protein
MVIYILAPARVYTGGPTALFQLCRELKANDVDVVMAFYGDTSTDPVHPNYKKYNCSCTALDDVRDTEDALLIVPETALDKIRRFKKAKRIIYWLAVDNYVLSLYKPSSIEFISYITKNYFFDMRDIINAFATGDIKVYYNAFVAKYVRSLIDSERVAIPKANLHIAQSIYAKEFLLSHNIDDNDIVQLREPLEEEFIEAAKMVKHDMKSDTIAWNSRKAYPVAYRLVNALQKRGYIVLKLENVGKERMAKILFNSKVFIDVGIHPGRDRPPREAIALDNIVITNNHGGCYHHEDCPVPEEFKWNCYFDCKMDINRLVEDLKDYLENYEYYIKQFQTAKHLVLSEPHVYKDDLKHLIKRLREVISG